LDNLKSTPAVGMSLPTESPRVMGGHVCVKPCTTRCGQLR
jgi:hypothetical protein